MTKADKSNNSLRLLALILPQDVGGGTELEQCLTNVDNTENTTGFDFMPNLSENVENTIESHIPTELWSITDTSVADLSTEVAAEPDRDVEEQLVEQAQESVADVGDFEICAVNAISECITLRNVRSKRADPGGWRISDEEASYAFHIGTMDDVGAEHTFCILKYTASYSVRALYLNNDDNCVLLYASGANTPVDSRCW